MAQILERRFIRRSELCTVTGIKTRAWDDWHRRGIGPSRIKAGRAVIYNLADVIAYLESRKESSISNCQPDGGSTAA